MTDLEQMAAASNENSAVHTEIDNGNLQHISKHSSTNLAKAADQSLESLNVHHQQDLQEEGEDSKMQRTSTILAANESVRQSQDSADVQQVLNSVPGPDQIKIDEHDRSNRPSVDSSQYKMLKTQNMELTLQAKSLSIPTAKREQSGSIEVDRHGAPGVENPHWNRSRDVIPITSQTRRNQQRSQNPNSNYRNKPDNMNFLHIKPRGINVHHQAKLQKSQEEYAMRKNTFPMRKVKRKYQRQAKHETINDVTPSEFTVISDGSKSPSYSRSPNQAQINTDLALKVNLNKTMALELNIQNQQPQISETGMDEGMGMESLFTDQHMRPNFESVKKAVPAFCNRKQKFSQQQSPLNIQVRARTTPFQQVTPDGRKLNIKSRFQRIMPTVESAHGNSQGSQETYVFASSWKNGGDFDVPEATNNQINVTRLDSRQRQQRVHTTTTAHHTQQAQTAPKDALSSTEPSNKQELGKPIRTPNEASGQSRKGFNCLIAKTKHGDHIKEERNSSFQVVQKQKAEALRITQDVVCPNSADTNLNEVDQVKMQQKFVKSSGSNQVMSQRETGSDNKSSIMMQQTNNSQACVNQPAGTNFDCSMLSLNDKQQEALEVTINKRDDASEDEEEEEQNHTEKGERQSSPLEKPQVLDTKIIGQKSTMIDSNTKLSKLNTFASVIVSQEDVASRTGFPAKKGRPMIETPEIRCSSRDREDQRTVVWNPKSTTKLATQDAWKKPKQSQQVDGDDGGVTFVEALEHEKNALPKISRSSNYRNSIYTQDKHRIQNLYTNMQRIAQVMDPQKVLTERQKQRLPEDKSFMAHLKNSMPQTLRPKAFGRTFDNPTPGQLSFMQNGVYDRQITALMSPLNSNRNQKRKMDHSSMAATSMPTSSRHQSQSYASTSQGHYYNSDLEHARHHHSTIAQHQQSHQQQQQVQHQNYHQQPELFSGETKIQRVTRRKFSTSFTGPSSSPTAQLESTNINFANLAQYPCRAGSRLQRQVEDLNVLGTNDVFSKQDHSMMAADENLPEVANTVKQWLANQQNTSLVLKRHQEVAFDRTGGGFSHPYRAKKSIDYHYPKHPQQLQQQQIYIETNLHSRNTAGTHKSNNSASVPQRQQNPSRLDTLRLQQSQNQQQCNGNNQRQVTEAGSSRMGQRSPLPDGLAAWQNSKEPQHSSMIDESSIDLPNAGSNAAGGGAPSKKRGAGQRDHSKFFNESCFIESRQTSAISPKLKKNLLINLPAPTIQQKSSNQRDGEAIESQAMFNQKGGNPAEVESRVGISMAAPTIETFSNVDNVSDDKSVYKGSRAVDRTATLGFGERASPQNSPLRQKNAKKWAGQLYQSNHYENAQMNDFSITVVSQNISLREKPGSPNRRKFNRAPIVPQIKGIEAVKKSDVNTSTEQPHPKMNAATQKQNDEDQKVTRSEPFQAEGNQTLRSVPINRDHVLNANQTPDSIDQDRMAPAPLISQRDATLIESSKDDYGSCSPSRHYGSMDQTNQLDPIIYRAAIDSIDSDRKVLINCLAHDSTTGEHKGSTVLTRLLKGQNPSLISTNRNVAVLDLEDVSCIKQTEIESGRVTPKPNYLQTTLLFHLNTLYSAQSRSWQKYDEQWAAFEKDHVKSQAPIPSSAQFLLVHLIQKTQRSGQFKRLAQVTPMKSRRAATSENNDDSELVSCASGQGRADRSGGSPCDLKKFSPTSVQSLAKGLVQLGKKKKSAQENAQKQPAPSKVSKVFGTDFVQLEVLDEAYRLARIRLQMCQGSLLYKFNDDDRRIFAQLRLQLTETYDKIKRSSCCITASAD